MIVKPPYPVLIKGIPHAPHPRFGFPMWQLLSGGDYTRCNKEPLELENAVLLKYKALPVTEEKREINRSYDNYFIGYDEYYSMAVEYLLKVRGEK